MWARAERGSAAAAREGLVGLMCWAARPHCRSTRLITVLTASLVVRFSTWSTRPEGSCTRRVSLCTIAERCPVAPMLCHASAPSGGTCRSETLTSPPGFPSGVSILIQPSSRPPLRTVSREAAPHRVERVRRVRLEFNGGKTIVPKHARLLQCIEGQVRAPLPMNAPELSPARGSPPAPWVNT